MISLWYVSLMKIKSTLVLLTLLFSCSQRNVLHVDALSSNKKLMATRDIPGFEVKTITKEPQRKIITDCRANIKSSLCILKKKEVGDSNRQECQPGSKKYIDLIQNIYDLYPPVLQKMFCSIRSINIEEGLDSTAYAYDLGKSNGVILGIRRSVLDKNLDLQTWASWKEQLSFGNINEDYMSSNTLPVLGVSVLSKVNDFLYYALAHEFAHFLDYANDINQFVDCDIELDSCPTTSGSWSELSWTSDLDRTQEDTFDGIKDFCFYSCEEKYLDISNIPELYDSLYETTFISTYATTNPWDDFAESFAFYIMDKYLDARIDINTNQGNNYQGMKKLHSKKFEAKYNFIESFLSRTDIHYPGQ